MYRALLAALLALLAAAPARAQTWLYDARAVLPSTDTGWNYLSIDPASGRLFIARRADGLLAWDTKAMKGVTVENSVGANDAILVPSLGRAYVAMTDGSVLTFDTSTLKPIARTDAGAGPLDNGFYEPTQNHVHIIAAAEGDKTNWVTIDALTGSVLGKTAFNSRQMETPATDGTGRIFAPLRDKALLQQVDAKDLSLQKTWKLGDCTVPVAVRWDAVSGRVLIGCRGDKPVFVALNPETGVVATVPIGRGVDGLAIDPKRHLIVTANGEDGTFSVIRQDGPDTYVLVETISTRPMAKDVVMDPSSGRLFTATATFTRPTPGADGKAKPLFFHPDSFTVLSFHPN